MADGRFAEEPMPFIDVLCQKASGSPSQRAQLADELTRVALEAEGLPDNLAARAIAVVTFREADDVYVGGRRDESPRFNVLLYVLRRALTAEKKRAVHAQVRGAFQKACPELLVRGGANVWSIVNEIEDGAFGSAGNPVSIEVVRALVERG
jgi:phenylpyruvate tautomerase PptA (4-oxalocrotonate tautomerase family)